jgi:lysophospholipase L1-like esterase
LTAWLARAAFWSLLPVTAVQGLWLRRRATRLPGAEGARHGVIGAGEEYHLLAIGDSIIDGVGTGRVESSLPVQFASELAAASGRRIYWRIEGCSGHAISNVIERLETLEHSAPVDLVLLSVGVNDVTGLSTTRGWRRSVCTLLQNIHARWPKACILFAGLPPMASFPLPPQPLRYSLGLRAATLDRIARTIIDSHPRAMHVRTRIDPSCHEFCEDGFHPSPESCTLWARELAALHTGRLNT